jgi:hypothetical protein
MKYLVALGLLALLGNPASPLEPRVHFLHAAISGDPMLVYYEVTAPFELKSVKIAGVPIKSWQFVTAFQKHSLEIELVTKPGLNAEWDRLEVIDSSGKPRALSVAPSRAMTVPEKPSYELDYERMEQQPSSRLYLGLRIFNDSAQTVTMDEFIYAPFKVSANRVLVNPRYDGQWFTKLEAWVRGTGGTPLPQGARLMDSSKLRLKILPSRGFSAAIVAQSFKPAFSCLRAGVKRDPQKRVDSAVLQPVIQYRVGSGKPQFYPIPDTILADLCP